MRSSTSWVVARLPADCSTNTRSGGGPEHVQLAVGADVVDAGVGARVGQEDQPLVEAEGQAVGHGRPSLVGAGPRAARAGRRRPARVLVLSSVEHARLAQLLSARVPPEGSGVQRRAGMGSHPVVVSTVGGRDFDVQRITSERHRRHAYTREDKMIFLPHDVIEHIQVSVPRTAVSKDSRFGPNPGTARSSASHEHAPNRVSPFLALTLHFLRPQLRFVPLAAPDERRDVVGARPCPDGQPRERGGSDRGRLGVCGDLDRASDQVGLELHEEPVCGRSAVRAQHADVERAARRVRPRPDARSPRARRARGAPASCRA